MSENHKIKIGVVGVGHLGKFHVEQYQSINEVDFVGLFDVDTERATKIATQFNANSYNNMSDLLDKCDGVSICTPTSTHSTIAHKAILGGCHVLIEKPITEDVCEAESLIALSKQHKKIIQVGHIERFNPAFCALNKKNMNPQFIESHRLSPFNIRGTDVDVILDLMIHDIDILITMVRSSVKHINASGVSVLSNTIDVANTRIEFDNGCVANMTASRISQKKLRKFRIFELHSYTNIDFLNPCVETYVLSNNKPKNDLSYIVVNENKEKYILYDKPTINSHNALRVELIGFIKSIQEKKDPVVSGEDGMRALDIAIQIRNQIKNKNK